MQKVETVGNWIDSSQEEETKGQVTLPGCSQSSSSKIYRFEKK